MQLFYRLVADLVLITHFAFVAVVLLGFLAILYGLLRGHDWARNFWVRTIHLSMILFVVFETIIGLQCLLTTLENWLRTRAGQQTYSGDFIAEWVHSLLFYEGPAWVFTLGYFTFGGAVLLTFLLAPPRWPGKRDASPEEAATS